MSRKKLRESNPKANEVEIARPTIDRIIAKPTFEYFDKPQVGVRFFVFKDKGDTLSGTVIGHAIANVRRNSSYPIRLDDSDEVVEVFANRTLHKQLKECVFQHVRIVYIGREQTSWGHAKKIYRVYRSKEGREMSLDQLRKKYNKAKKKNKKVRAGK